MVNGVPREVLRPKAEAPQAPVVFGRGTSRGTPFTMIHLRLFHTFSFFCHPGLVKRNFFQPMESLGQYASPGCRKNEQSQGSPSVPSLAMTGAAVLAWAIMSQFSLALLVSGSDQLHSSLATFSRD